MGGIGLELALKCQVSGYKLILLISTGVKTQPTELMLEKRWYEREFRNLTSNKKMGGLALSSSIHDRGLREM